MLRLLFLGFGKSGFWMKVRDGGWGGFDEVWLWFVGVVEVVPG